MNKPQGLGTSLDKFLAQEGILEECTQAAMKRVYDCVCEEIRELWNATPGSKEEERLKLLAEWVVAYEGEHCPIDEPTEDDIRRFIAEQNS